MELKSRTVKQDSHDKAPWKLMYLPAAADEARKILTQGQYAHVVQIFEQLALEPNPAESKAFDIRTIDEFLELREKGGLLGKINLRVYFYIHGKRKIIIALKTYKKEDEGQTPEYFKVAVRNRLRNVKEMLTQKEKTNKERK